MPWSPLWALSAHTAPTAVPVTEPAKLLPHPQVLSKIVASASLTWTVAPPLLLPGRVLTAPSVLAHALVPGQLPPPPRTTTSAVLTLWNALTVVPVTANPELALARPVMPVLHANAVYALTIAMVMVSAKPKSNWRTTTHTTPKMLLSLVNSPFRMQRKIAPTALELLTLERHTMMHGMRLAR